MKKPFLSNVLWMACALAFCGALSSIALAAAKKDARVTQVIRDVRLLGSKSAAKPASVNDPVAEGQAVRTGGESRAELTFTDRSITRLGANTVFTYGEGARVMDLTSGAALIVVPKESGTIRVNTAATTAAVSGFVALVESHVTAATKWMIIAGHACVKRRGKGHGGDKPCVNLNPGDMLIIQPGTRGNGTVEKFDIPKAIGSALLLTDFGKLPKWALNDIQEGIDSTGGNGGPPGNGKDPTGHDAIDQKAATDTTRPGFIPPPGSPPPSSANRPR
jgi:FecR protein